MHLGRVFPLIGQVWQVKPASHALLVEEHVSPILRLEAEEKKQSVVSRTERGRLTERLNLFILENFSLPFLALEKEEIYEGKPVRVWNGEGDAESFVR